MTKEDQPLNGNEPDSTPDEKRESEEPSEDLESLFGEESDDDSQKDAPVTRDEFNRLIKGVKKLATDKGRAKTQDPKEQPKEQKEAPAPQSNDDVTELFLESKPEAELVKDDLKTVADAKYGGSIIKAWKGEAWLHAKAQVLAEANKAKKKVSPPSNQIEGELDFADIAKMPDEQQAKAIKGMSNKDYNRWQEYQRKSSNKPGQITLS